MYVRSVNSTKELSAFMEMEEGCCDFRSENQRMTMELQDKA